MLREQHCVWSVLRVEGESLLVLGFQLLFADHGAFKVKGSCGFRDGGSREPKTVVLDIEKHWLYATKERI